MLCGQGYAVGIQNQWAGYIFQRPADKSLGIRCQPKAAAQQHGIHLGQTALDFTNGFAAQRSVPVWKGEDHRLVELYCFNGIDALRHAQKYQTCPAAQCPHGGKVGSTGKAPAAAQQQELAEVSLVGILRAVGQKGKNAILIQHHGSVSHVAVLFLTKQIP